MNFTRLVFIFGMLYAHVNMVGASVQEMAQAQKEKEAHALQQMSDQDLKKVFNDLECWKEACNRPVTKPGQAEESLGWADSRSMDYVCHKPRNPKYEELERVWGRDDRDSQQAIDAFNAFRIVGPGKTLSCAYALQARADDEEIRECLPKIAQEYLAVRKKGAAVMREISQNAVLAHLQYKRASDVRTELWRLRDQWRATQVQPDVYDREQRDAARNALVACLEKNKNLRVVHEGALLAHAVCLADVPVTRCLLQAGVCPDQRYNADCCNNDFPYLSPGYNDQVSALHIVAHFQGDSILRNKMKRKKENEKENAYLHQLKHSMLQAFNAVKVDERVQITRMLLEAGADPLAKDSNGRLFTQKALPQVVEVYNKFCNAYNARNAQIAASFAHTNVGTCEKSIALIKAYSDYEQALCEYDQEDDHGPISKPSPSRTPVHMGPNGYYHTISAPASPTLDLPPDSAYTYSGVESDADAS